MASSRASRRAACSTAPKTPLTGWWTTRRTGSPRCVRWRACTRWSATGTSRSTARAAWNARPASRTTWRSRTFIANWRSRR
ncbi:MAG: hypothetical protein ACK56I_05010, partial [bacterium]